MTKTIEIRERVPLAPLCTLDLGGPARYFIDAPTEDAVRDALEWAYARALPVFVLGAGSNVVVSDQGFDGLVLRVALRGVRSEIDRDVISVTAAAGEAWDSLVAETVNAGWTGLECLSGIPGSVGATPVQNVGAYGQDVAQTITEVRVMDPETREVRSLTRAQCGFGYRDSAFKRKGPPAAGVLILAVTFTLRPNAAPTVHYPELSRSLANRGHPNPTPAEVRETVLALRRAKSMVLDPSDPNRRSVGSFFTNPVVSAEQAGALVASAVNRGLVSDCEKVPQFPAAGGRVKLAAAWLIEQSGFRKGERRGAVGISSRHALALVHHGGGTTRDLLAFAEEIQTQVSTVFGVELVLEPVRVGR